MAQLQLTNEQRIRALERLGYSEREAAFLCMAALHGGYFLRRQYADFLGKSVGGTAAVLIEKVLAKGHAKGTTFAANTYIYHLCARPVYAAIGQEDNRNRRLREPTTIKNKLMGLDFVLSHSGHQYLATEQEKVEYFTVTLGIEKTLLPATRYASRGQTTERYFVETFPVFLAASSQDAGSPVVSFCFIDEGLVGISAFQTFLEKYIPLLASLREFNVIYVATNDAHFGPARRILERAFGPKSERDFVPDEALTHRMLQHFETRRLHETQQWNGFDRAKLIQFRDERKEFSGDKFEALYRLWTTSGAAAVKASFSDQKQSGRLGCGSLLTCRLEQNYDFFGNTIVD